MDFDEKKKRQRIRIIIAEVGMVLSIIAIVIVSTLAAMGFMISGDGSIEQSGLMQLHSIPTGANVRIDGSTLFPRTNLSRTLSEGQHSIEIYRDGYDSWKNTIKIKPGTLLRIYYPRLFLQNRTQEKVSNLATVDNLEFYVPSPNRNYILYAEKGASDWQLLDLRGDEVKTTILDLSGILPGMLEEKLSQQLSDGIAKHTYKFHGAINEIRWSNNEENVLVNVDYGEHTSWMLIRLKDIAHSVDLSKTFGLSDAKLSFIDSSASQLYALEKQQLRRINTNDNTMSRILLNNVESFANFGTNIIYTTKVKDAVNIAVYKDDEKAGTVIASVSLDSKVKVAISKYYDEDYLAYAVNQQVFVLHGRVPSYNENGADLSGLQKLVESLELMETPEYFTVNPEGQYIVARKDKKYMVINLDMGDLHEYDAPTATLKWFDSSMMYAVVDGKIIVWDFDGTNQRNLGESLQNSEQSLPVQNNSAVVVTGNNRYMYYLTADKKFVVLTREKIWE